MAQIFLSYAHDDNKPLSFEPDGWISRLNRDLKVWALTLPEPKPEFWLDYLRIRAGERFSPAIKTALAQSELLLPIISPNWLKSRDCQNEWSAFSRQTQCEGQTGNHTPVIPILFSYQKADVHNFEEPFKSLNFDAALRYELTMDKNAYMQFFAALTKELLGRLAELPEPPMPTRPKLPGVFVAHAVRSLKTARETIINELVTQKFDVVDGEVSEENTARDVIKLITDVVPSCVAAIHFFGGSLGAIPVGETRPSIELQFDEVRRLKPRLQVGWSKPEFKPDSYEFLTDIRKHLGTEYWQMEPPRCAAELVKRIRELLKPPPPDPPSYAIRRGGGRRGIEQDSGPDGREPSPPVYVMYDSSDGDAGEAIEKYLFGLGHEPLSLSTEGISDSEYRRQHQELLKTIQLFYIYHGKVRTPWSNLKKTETIKAKYKPNSRKFLGGVVYLGPEVDENKRKLVSREFDVRPKFNEPFDPKGTWPPRPRPI